MKITAVVVTYNRLALLKKGIDALCKQSSLTDIIVVDNGATDGTHEWLDEVSNHELQTSNFKLQGNKVQSSKFKLQSLTVIHQDNVGGSGGFYTGIKAAYESGADWIWCMDDDVFPREDCLDHLLQHIDEPEVGILSPRRLLEGKVFTHEFCRFNFTNPFGSMHGEKLGNSQLSSSEDCNHKVQSSKFKVQSSSTHKVQSSKFKVQSIVGCDFEGPFISRKVVEKIGLPNKDLFIFCDDTDYCLRAHLAGFRLYYVPDALMDKHKFFSNDTWTTRNQKKKWKRYYQIRNETYLNHHYGKNWGVRYLRGLLGVIGYYIPALVTMPFTHAYSFKDLKTLWQAYKDGINERLGKHLI